ncbi:MAG: hypothetical protein P8Z34_14965 [Anaerolineales bacterium]
MNLQAAHMQLLREPKEPIASALYLYGTHLPENQDWRSFLEGW